MQRTLIGGRAQYEFLGETKADAGYYLLELCGDIDRVPELFFNPIVAWALETGTYCPYPVTLKGVKTENLAILRPDGMVFTPSDGAHFNDVDEWLAQHNAPHALKRRGVTA